MRKKMVLGVIFTGLVTGFRPAAKAQSMGTDSTRIQLNKWVASKNQSDQQLLNNKLASLAASNQEQDMLTASQYYFRLKQTGKSDSLNKAILSKFPLGKQARSTEEQLVYNAKTGAAKEAAFAQWMTKFPPEKFKTGAIDDPLVYDYARADIATQYANEKNVKKAVAAINTLQTDFWKANAYLGLSNAFYKNGDLANAAVFAKRGMESSESYVEGKKGNSTQGSFSAIGYPGLTLAYANILSEEKKNAEALPIFEKAHKSAKSINPQLNYRYAQLLMGQNRTQEAYDKLEEVVKAGKASPEIADQFKKLYVKVKGSDAGFGEYATAIRKSYLENLSKKLTKEMINEQAGDFSLTDLNGKQVSLKDLKGKVVILDFWATWCGPCKRSFPAMQMAANKYKDDPNVQFLFIHTWERTNTAAQDAKNYINSMKYNFEVLMDLKDPQTKLNNAVTAYKVSAIPAKFVVDGQGKIRFRLNPGTDSSNEAVVDEISMMVEMSKKTS